MFQVFLIIFWATIRLQSRGGAVYDPSVGDPSGSQPLRFASEPPPLDRGGNGDSLDRGGDPSVSRADSSPWQGSQGRWLAALFSLPPLPRGGGAGAKRMARWGRVSFDVSSNPSVSGADSSPCRGANPSVGNPSGSQANHLPLTGEATPPVRK